MFRQLRAALRECPAPPAVLALLAKAVKAAAEAVRNLVRGALAVQLVAERLRGRKGAGAHLSVTLLRGLLAFEADWKVLLGPPPATATPSGAGAASTAGDDSFYSVGESLRYEPSFSDSQATSRLTQESAASSKRSPARRALRAKNAAAAGPGASLGSPRVPPMWESVSFDALKPRPGGPTPSGSQLKRYDSKLSYDDASKSASSHRASVTLSTGPEGTPRTLLVSTAQSRDLGGSAASRASGGSPLSSKIIAMKLRNSFQKSGTPLSPLRPQKENCDPVHAHTAV